MEKYSKKKMYRVHELINSKPYKCRDAFASGYFF